MQSIRFLEAPGDYHTRTEGSVSYDAGVKRTGVAFGRQRGRCTRYWG